MAALAGGGKDAILLQPVDATVTAVFDAAPTTATHLGTSPVSFVTAK